jgi:hypothetical protein
VLKYPVDIAASFGTISLLTLYIGYLLLRFHRGSGDHYLICKGSNGEMACILLILSGIERLNKLAKGYGMHIIIMRIE